MIINKTGDLLKSDCQLIAHQVNVYGVMGGGIARQIAELYPGCEQKYHEYCNKHDFSFDRLQCKVYYHDNGNIIIANIFSQMEAPKNGTLTDYEALKIGLKLTKQFAKKFNLTIGIPHGIGCGIAGGDWNIVHNILKEVYTYYDITVYRL